MWNLFLDRGRLARWLGALCVPLLLVACANPALKEAERLRQSGDHEGALNALQAAYRANQDDASLKGAYVKQRDTTVASLIYQAEMADRAGRADEHLRLLQRLEAVAPTDSRVLTLREGLERRKRHAALLDEARTAMKAQDLTRAETTLRTLLAADSAQPEARAMLAQIDEQRAVQTRQQTSLKLTTASKNITLEFRDAALRTVFEALARAANVNFVFDKEVRGEAKVSLFLRNTTVDEALRVILNTQQLGFRLLNDNTVLVFPNTAQKQRDLLDTVTRSFYLVNADPKQAQNLIRTVAKSRDMHVDERLSLLVVRDTPDVMRLIERLIASIDLPDPEVMLELEVMEVSSKKVNELGLQFPETVNYGIPGSTAALTSLSGLRTSAANPLAIATLRGTSDATNLLANPKIRARNREKAKISLGEKLPVFSTTTTNSTAVSTAVNITYVDVGLKLELEPQVQLNNEVMIKVSLEVTNITSQVSGPQGSTAYQVGSRIAQTSLRLKDGETQVLAGLISDDESKNAAGLPWIHDLPVVGRLFGRTRDTTNKTEVVLLITPRIVRSLNQSPLPMAAMPSGTEAQPGAAPFVVAQGQVASDVSRRPGGPSLGAPAQRGRQTDAPVTGPRITGPEIALPGATIALTIYNPDDRPLDAQFQFDPALFEAPGDKNAGNGNTMVQVPPRSQASVTLRVKPDAPNTRSEFRLDTGGQGWSIQLGQPSEPSDAPEPPEVGQR